MFFRSSVAKDIARRLFLERVQMFAAKYKFTKAQLLTLLLPGPQGIEIPYYKHFGIPGGSILGVEQEWDVFQEIRHKRWDINLYFGSLDGLVYDLIDYFQTGRKPDNLFLVDGMIKNLLEARQIPLFRVLNIDPYCDIGNFAYSPNAEILSLVGNASMVAVTAQARRDPLSVEGCSSYLKCLVECGEPFNICLETMLQAYRRHTNNRHEQANRMLLRDISLIFMFMLKRMVSTAQIERIWSEVVRRELISIKPEDPGDHQGLQRRINHLLSSLEEVRTDDGKLMIDRTLREQIIKTTKTCLTRVEDKAGDLLRMFQGESLLEIMHLIDIAPADEFFYHSLLHSPSLADIRHIGRVLYQSENGTPMLMWIMNVLLPKAGATVLGSIAGTLGSFAMDGFVHIDKKGKCLYHDSRQSQVIPISALKEWYKPMYWEIQADNGDGKKVGTQSKEARSITKASPRRRRKKRRRWQDGIKERA